MKINIENFKGISNLEYELKDNKINFLFGISGSGKSSIATALIDEETENHIKVGANKNQLVIKVNDNNVNRTDFKIFDLSYLNNVLISRDNTSEVYNIVYGDGGNIDACRNDYNNAITDLESIKETVLLSITEIKKLQKELKISYNKTNQNQYNSTCLIRKVSENVEHLPKYRNIITYSAKEVKWLKDGTNMKPYMNRRCPFCSRKLTDYRINKIGEILEFDISSYEKITANSSSLSNLNISVPNWSNQREVDKFNTQIKEYITILPELNEINSYIDLARKTTFTDEKVEKVTPSSTLKRLYPNIVNQIKLFNSKISSINNKLNKLKKETNSLISNNVKKINSKLKLLGIPYKFVDENIDADNKSVDFVIKHIDDDKNNDMSSSLSFGEKNLISLLLFLLGSKDAHTLIIDDPASSFDDYRRKVIFDFIYELSGDKTVLVLSHDAVFAKYALFYSNAVTKPNSNQKLVINRTGNIDYLENYSTPIVKSLVIDDFNTMDYFVRARLNSLGKNMNYIIAINLRILYEINQEKKCLEYKYLSAIIHRTPYNKIMDALANLSKSEADVLSLIHNKYNIDLNPLDSDYVDHIEEYEYKPIENVFRFREVIVKNSPKTRLIYDELSNIIHMNSAQVICLNPYEYKYYSKFVDSYIESKLR